MTIWVDSDSCPKQIRNIILRASVRVGIFTIFVANRPIPGVEGEYSGLEVVEKGEGVADRYILENSVSGDIAVTHDIPLAADLVAKGVLVLDDRGSVFTEDNVRERLSVRNAMTELRSYGVMPKPGGSLSGKDIQQFANALDRELRKWIKSNR